MSARALRGRPQDLLFLSKPALCRTWPLATGVATARAARWSTSSASPAPPIMKRLRLRMTRCANGLSKPFVERMDLTLKHIETIDRKEVPMGTRSNIFVTGRGQYSAEHGTVRLYRHWDGDPGTVLHAIVQAHLLAEPIVGRQKEFHPEAHLTGMPAEGFAQLLIAASCRWDGASIRLDADRDAGWPPANFDRPFNMEMLTRQEDLKWVYLVELPPLRLTIYGGYGDAAHLIGLGALRPFQ